MIFNRPQDVAKLFCARIGRIAREWEVIGVMGFDPPSGEAHGAHRVEGGVPTQGGVVRSHGAEPQSTGEVTGRSSGRYGLLCCSNALSHTNPSVPYRVATSPLCLLSLRGRQIDKFGHH